MTTFRSDYLPEPRQFIHVYIKYATLYAPYPKYRRLHPITRFATHISLIKVLVSKTTTTQNFEIGQKLLKAPMLQHRYHISKFTKVDKRHII